MGLDLLVRQAFESWNLISQHAQKLRVAKGLDNWRELVSRKRIGQSNKNKVNSFNFCNDESNSIARQKELCFYVVLSCYTCFVSQPNYKESRMWSSRCDNRSGDPQVALIQPREGLDECHDVTEENGASFNTPHKVGTEDKLRHKQDRDTIRHEGQR